MRKFALIGMGMLLAVLWASVASAELTLWLKYHYAAEEAYERGEYNRAEQLFKAAERESIITLPEDNFRRATTLDGLGLVYTAQGRLDEADEVLQRALDMKKEVLGPHTREVPETVLHIADLRYAQGQYDKVERLYRHALLILIRDQTDIGVTRALNGLAAYYRLQGDAVRAESLLERARKIHILARRRNHPAMADTLVELGRLYAFEDRDEESVPLYEKACAIRVENLGMHHPQTAACYEEYAQALHRVGRVDEAKELEQRTKEIRENHARIEEQYATEQSPLLQ
ncbi:MAG: tetratricopeptide repeat protein [Candidatus Hydrogenedentota bacterium]